MSRSRHPLASRPSHRPARLTHPPHPPHSTPRPRLPQEPSPDPDHDPLLEPAEEPDPELVLAERRRKRAEILAKYAAAATADANTPLVERAAKRLRITGTGTFLPLFGASHLFQFPRVNKLKSCARHRLAGGQQ